MTLCEAMGKAFEIAARKQMGVYIMRRMAGAGFEACLFCDHCPTLVVGVVLPDGSYHGFATYIRAGGRVW